MRRPGFTLLEVVIVTLFITLCVWGGRAGYRWYVRSGHADEARLVLEKMSKAQRKYQANHDGATGAFLGCSEGRLQAFPREIPAEGAEVKELPACFKELYSEPFPSPFFFRIAVYAGFNEPPPATELEGSALKPFFFERGQPWFLIVAFADQDGDGEFSRLEVASWDDSGVVETDRTE